MSIELSALVRTICPQFEESYQLIQSSFDASSFGNSIAHYSSPLVDVRIIRDRGELICEVRRSGMNDRWVALRMIAPDLPKSLRQRDEPRAIKEALLFVVDNAEVIHAKVGSQG